MRIAVLLWCLAGCSGGAAMSGDDLASAAVDQASVSSADAAGGDAATGNLTLPPANGKLDYQLGGAYPPPAGVTVLSRDRNDMPAGGLYTICYVNGFQIQPDELADWQANHAELILKDAGGTPIIDADWNEALIDVSTPAKRTAVAAIVGDWIDGCADHGFAAIEIDNLDSYARSQGKLTADDAVATIALFAERAHARGLPIAQKNSSELVSRKAAMHTDFAVAEECNRYDECDVYTAGYGDYVFIIEYRQADFTKGCAAYPGLSIVLRDRDLVTPSNGAYVYDGC